MSTRRSLKVSRFFIILVMLAVAFDAVCAEERIVSFAAEVIIQKSGAVVITETISVEFTAASPQVGIVRSVPIKMLGADNKIQSAAAHVNYVFRDGAAEHFVVETQAEAVLIRIGDREILSPGVHTFVLQYEKPNLVGLGKDFDGFAIALPGKWSWSVDSATLLFKLPEFLDSSSVVVSATVSGYSDQSGRGDSVAPTMDAEKIQIRYPKRLPAGRTLWISLKMPKGFIRP